MDSSTIAIVVSIILILGLLFILFFLVYGNLQDVNTLNSQYNQLYNTISTIGLVFEGSNNTFTGNNSFSDITTFNSNLFINSRNVHSIKEWAMWGYGGTNLTTFYLYTSSSNITVSQASTGAYNVRITDMTGISGFASVCGSAFSNQIFGQGSSYQIYQQNQQNNYQPSSNTHLWFFII